MGHAESKFHKAVRAGDYGAYDIYFGKKLIRDSVDPHYRFEDDSTLLHYTALYAMQPIYEDFLEKKSASPLVLDGSNRTCLHLICMNSQNAKVRADMLQTTLANSMIDVPRSLQLQDQVSQGKGFPLELIVFFYRKGTRHFTMPLLRGWKTVWM